MAATNAVNEASSFIGLFKEPTRSNLVNPETIKRNKTRKMAGRIISMLSDYCSLILNDFFVNYWLSISDKRNTFMSCKRTAHLTTTQPHLVAILQFTVNRRSFSFNISSSRTSLEICSDKGPKIFRSQSAISCKVTSLVSTISFGVSADLSRRGPLCHYVGSL